MSINRTIAAYDKYAEIYDQETIEFWEKFPRSVIAEFIKLLPGKRVLNLGSGPGRDALLLREAGLDVLCVDASAEMVRRTQDLGFESTSSDITALDYPNDEFDGIWAYTSLLHVPTDKMITLLHRTRSWLRIHGVLLIGMIEGEFQGEITQDNMPNMKRYFKYYQESELIELISQAGFELRYQERYQPHRKVYLNQLYIKSAKAPHNIAP